MTSKMRAMSQTDTHRPDLSFIIPAYNEEDVIGETIGRILSDFPGAEIIVSDDGSRDLTAIRSRDAGGVVVTSAHLGKGAAVRRGMLASSGRIRVTVDADLPCSSSDIRRIVRSAEEHGAAIGERTKIGESLLRSLSSVAFRVFVQSLFTMPYRDTQCGLKGFRDNVAEALFGEELKLPGLSYDVEILLRAKNQSIFVDSVPVRWVDTRSHLSIKSCLLDTLSVCKLWIDQY